MDLTHYPVVRKVTQSGGLSIDNAGNLSFDGSGYDASGSASGVQGNLDTHVNGTGTAVHGLGSASTRADTDFLTPSGDGSGLSGVLHSASTLAAVLAAGNTGAAGQTIVLSGATSGTATLSASDTGGALVVGGGAIHIPATLTDCSLYLGTSVRIAGGDNYSMVIFGGTVYAAFGVLDFDTFGLDAHIKGLKILGLAPTSAPGSPVEGQIYYDSGTHHFFGWTGAAWKQLDN